MEPNLSRKITMICDNVCFGVRFAAPVFSV